jgi:ankyrin repeat protein
MNPRPSDDIFACLESNPPDIDRATQLLEERRDLMNAKDEKTGETPLIRAMQIIERANTPLGSKESLDEFVIYLLKQHDVNLHAQDKLGDTALHHAVRNRKDRFITPIHHIVLCNACSFENCDKLNPVELMLKEKEMYASVLSAMIQPIARSYSLVAMSPQTLEKTKEETVTCKEEVKSIFNSLAMLDLDNVRQTIDQISAILNSHPLLINAQAADGQTPLIRAAKHFADAVNALQQKKQDSKSNSAEMNALQKKIQAYQTIISFILQKDAVYFGRNLQDQQGCTALHYVSASNISKDYPIYQELLRAQVDPNILNKQGETPLDMLQSDDQTAVETLRKIAGLYNEVYFSRRPMPEPTPDVSSRVSSGVMAGGISLTLLGKKTTTTPQDAAAHSNRRKQEGPH